MRAFEFLTEAESELPSNTALPVDPATAQKQQERLDYVTNLLKNNPEFLRKVYSMSKIDPTPPKKLKKGEEEPQTDKINIQKYLTKNSTAPEEDQLPKDVLKEFVKALSTTDSDVDDLEEFLINYGQYDYVNISTLKTPNKRVSTESILKGEGKVSEQFVKNLYGILFGIQTKSPTRGPGEIALALLSPKITFAPQGKGDLMIDGDAVEVKGQGGTKGGRLMDSAADFGTPNIDKVYATAPDLPVELKVPLEQITGNPSARKTNLLDLAQKLEAHKVGLGKLMIETMAKETYKFATEYFDTYFNNALNMDRNQFKNALGKMGFQNYMARLEGKAGGDGQGAQFDHVLLMSPTATLYFNKSDMEKNIESNFKVSSIDWGDKQKGPSPQLSI